MMNVVCPNALPGSEIMITDSNGQQMIVKIPEGVKPGQMFRVDTTRVGGGGGGGNRLNAEDLPTVPNGSSSDHGPFRYGLFDCCERGIGQCLCMSMFMPCGLANGMTRVRGRGWIGYLICGSLPFGHAHARMKFREQYNIEQDLQEDCLQSIFCTPCSVLQLMNEIHDKTGSDYGCCGCLGICTDSDLQRQCDCCVVCCTSIATGCRSCVRRCCCDL